MPTDINRGVVLVESRKTLLSLRWLSSSESLTRIVSGQLHRGGRLVTCVLLLCLGFHFLVSSVHAQGPGLYKDGKKILDLAEMIDSSFQAAPAAPFQMKPARMKLLEEVFGDKIPSKITPQKDYVRLVLECRDLFERTVSFDQTDSAFGLDIDRLLALEGKLAQANELLLQKFSQVEKSLEENAYPEHKIQRHAQMVENHTVAANHLAELLASLRVARESDDRSAIEGIIRELEQYFIDNIFRQEPPLLSSQPLPVMMQVKEAPVVEGQLPEAIPYPRISKGERGPQKGDLDPTIDVQFTDDIIALAASLNNSPVEMYNYVRDNFEFEAYLGSRKGSQQTLSHRRGNDYDQASLLIALLRVSGIPARYARAKIKMPIEQATNWLGIQDKRNAGSILTTCGMEGIIYIVNDDTVAIGCRRVWVEAWIPFINYRGAVNDSVGYMWVPMDPTFKQYQYTPGINLPAEIGFDAEALVWDYISTMHTETPVEMFKQMLLDSLAVRYPGAAYEDLITKRSVIKETDGILPGTLPFELLEQDTVFSEIPSDKRYRIRFHLYGGAGMDLDYETSLPEIAEKQVTISYIGANPEDQYTIDTAGGIFNITTPYIIDLLPVLKIDGCEVARGEGGYVTLGDTHSSVMHFIPPVGASNQMPTVSNTITAGNYQGIGIDTEDAIPAFFGGPELACDENTLGKEQHQLALTYLNKVDLGGDEVTDLMHQVVINDVSEAIVENSVTVSFIGKYPSSIEWTGMIVDADRKIIGPFSVDGADNDCDYMRLAGADGSIQENRLFEDRFEEEAISAIKILELASDSGITICEITYSIAAECSGFSHPQSVRDAVNAALGQGHHVIIPERGFTYYEWTGTGYIDIDPVTCAAGYIISGGHGGGATVQVWLIPWFLWFSGIKCEKATGPVTVSPLSPDDNYCSNSWAFWKFSVPLIQYYAKDRDGNCFVKYSHARDFQMWYPVWLIAWIWGPGDYVFTAGGPGECAQCGSAEKTVTIVEVQFASDDVRVCKDASKTLGVTVTPSGAPVTFTSSDPDIATVSGSPPSLTITGVDGGNASVVAVVGGAECKSKGVTSVEIEFPPEDFYACKGGDRTMNVTVTPEGAPVTFKSSNTAVATVSGSPPNLTIHGVSVGTATIKAVVDEEECESKDISTIGTSIDGYVYGEVGRKIADMQNLPGPANVVASGYMQFQATIEPSGLADDFYYKWSVPPIGGGTLTHAEGSGSDYLIVKWDAPDGHEHSVPLTFEVKESSSGPTICTETVDLKTIRPYVIRVKFVDDFLDEEQQIAPLAESDPEYDAGTAYPVCYVRNTGMQVQVDLAGNKNSDSGNDLARKTKILVTATAKYGGIPNPFNEDLIDANTEDWSIPDYGTLEIESDNNLPNIVTEYEDFEMHWTFKVMNSVGNWFIGYEEVPGSGYSQTTEHHPTTGGRTYGLYLTHDSHEFNDPADFKKLTLDYACNWAIGQNQTDPILQALLDSFETHYSYVYGGNCYYLAKDFDHLCKCLGIYSKLHRWSEDPEAPEIEDMVRMYPKQFDPIGACEWSHFQDKFGDGSEHGHGWSYHEWVEASGSIYDPSAGVKRSGDWGGYEDACFNHYYKYKTVVPEYDYERQENQTGQSSGCEAEGHRLHIDDHVWPEYYGQFYGPPYASPPGLWEPCEEK